MALYSNFYSTCTKTQDTYMFKNLYRICIKVRWCRDSILQKKFWKFIPHTCVHPCISTHTPAHTCAHTCVHPRIIAYQQIPMHTRPHPHTPGHTLAHSRLPTHTHAYPRIPAHTNAHLRTTMHTRTHPRTHPKHTHWCPYLDISHEITCKWKKGGREKERKKKEQESAEAISGLRNVLFFQITM